MYSDIDMECTMDLATFREFLPRATEAFFLFPGVTAITMRCTGTENDGGQLQWTVTERREFRKVEGEWRLVSSDTSRNLNNYSSGSEWD